MCAEWLDRKNGLAKRLTVTVVLPSGIDENEITVEVSYSNLALQIDVLWPAAILNTETLLNNFILDKDMPHYTSDHAEVIALEKNLKDMRRKIGCTRPDPLKSY